MIKFPDQVEIAQNTMLEAMKFLLRKNHPDDWDKILAKLLILLYDLRHLTELHRVQEERIGMEWSSEITFPPVIYEICST